MERKYSRPLHVIASCYYIILHPPKLQGTQATSLRLVPPSSVFCTEFTSLRIKCLMAFTLFSLAASRMSRPRIPFKSKVLCKISDVWTCSESLKAPNQELDQAKDWNAQTRKSEWTHCSIFWKRKNSGQHAKLEHTQKGKEFLLNIIWNINVDYTSI